MPGIPSFAELLNAYLAERRMGARGLSELVEMFFSARKQPELEKLPHASVQNWLSDKSGKRRPQDQEQVLQIAVALGLNRAQTTQLLLAARWPTLDQLAESVRLRRTAHQTLEADRRLVLLLADWEGEPPHNLPHPVNSFIGRDDERLTYALHLTTKPERLLTLTGPGGVGKTRLALEIARLLLDAFPDGVWLLRLDTVRSADEVLPLIARRIGVTVGDPATLGQRLGVRLRNRRVLLVLDNLEHLLKFGPALAALLAATRDLCVIATSRVALGITGEITRPVRPFVLGERNLAPRDEPAVQLFAARASTVDPDFVLTTTTVRAVVALAQQLDGLPLGLELAATRLHELPFEELQRRFARGLDLGEGGGQDVPLHQRSLRRMIGWSYQLLTPVQRLLLRHLALLPNGGTRAVVAAMLGRIDDADLNFDLDDLVDYHMAEHRTGTDGDHRYSLPTLIREYAEEHAIPSEVAAARRLLLARYTATALGVERRQLGGSDLGTWRQRLLEERANVYATLEWALTGDPTGGLRLASYLRPFWQLGRGEADGRRWLNALLAATPDEPGADRARALYSLGYLEVWHDLAAAREALTRAYALATAAGETELALASLPPLCYLLYAGNDMATAQGYLREWQARPEAASDVRLAALLGLVQGFGAYRTGDFARARQQLMQALEQSQRGDTPFFDCLILIRLGAIHQMQGRLEEARETFTALLTLAQKLGATRYEVLSRYRLGMLAEATGEEAGLATAAAAYAAAHELADETDDDFGRGHALLGAGRLALRRDQAEEAVEQLGAALDLARRHSDPYSIAEVAQWQWLALWRAGEHREARRQARECLTLVRGSTNRRGQVELLTALAWLAKQGGEAERATAWYGAAADARREFALPITAADRALFAVPNARRALRDGARTLATLTEALDDAHGWLTGGAKGRPNERGAFPPGPSATSPGDN